jgi:hypothetical protein
MLALLLISLAHADPRVVTVNKGEVAPFSGTLFNAEATAGVLSSSNTEEKRCQIKTILEVKTALSTLERDKEIVDLKLASCESSLSKLEAENIDLTKKYNRAVAVKPYVAAAGFVSGIGLSIIIVNALGGMQ